MATEDDDKARENAIQEARQVPDEALTITDSPEPVPVEQDSVDDKKSEQSDDKHAAPTSDDGTKPPDSATDDDKTDKAKRRRDRKSERRIKNLQKNLSDTARREKETAERLAAAEAELAQLRSKVKPAAEPKFEDFDSPKEFADAYKAWETEQSKADEQPATTKKPEQQSDATQDQVTPPDPEDIADFRQRATEKLGDTFLATDDIPPEEQAISQQMGEFVLDSDYGPEVYTYLMTNFEEAQAIFDATPKRAQRMLEQLEKDAEAGTLLELSTGETDNKDEEEEQGSQSTRKTTKAPTPPGDTTSDGKTQTKPDPDAMATDDYMEWRQKQHRANRRF